MRPNIDTNTAKTNSIGGPWGIHLFVLLVCTGIITAFVICSGLFSWTIQIKSILLQLYIIAAVFGWFAFSSSINKERFQKHIVMACVISFPVIGMITTFYAIFFWLSLIVFTCLGIISAIDKSGYKGDEDKFFVAIYSTWIIVGMIVTLGSFSFLPYAESAIAGENLSLFLNIRFVITALVLAIFVGKAMKDAFDGPQIKVTPLPDILIPDKEDDNPMLKPFLTIINAILMVIQKLTNVIWSAIVMLAIFLYRTGINLANRVMDLLENKDIWIGIGRVLLTFAILVLFTLLISTSAESLSGYLSNNTSLFTISLGDFFILLLAGLIFSIAMSFIVLECWLWELVDTPLNRTAFGGAMFLLGCALAGLIVYVLAKTDTLQLNGFKTLGLYTLFMMVAITSIFIYQIAARGLKGTQPQKESTVNK
jgi:hypothetical protein